MNINQGFQQTYDHVDHLDAFKEFFLIHTFLCILAVNSLIFITCTLHYVIEALKMIFPEIYLPKLIRHPSRYKPLPNLDCHSSRQTKIESTAAGQVQMSSTLDQTRPV